MISLSGPAVSSHTPVLKKSQAPKWLQKNGASVCRANLENAFPDPG